MIFLRKLARDNRAATAIEYGLIAALISVAAIAAMSTLGKSVSATMNRAAASMK